MRLIDADALKYKLIRELNKTGKYTPYECGLDDALSYVNEQPTLEAEPVVHGRWDEWWPPKHMILTGEEMLYRCSVCDAKYSDKENMRYCPHCGAKVDDDTRYRPDYFCADGERSDNE